MKIVFTEAEAREILAAHASKSLGQSVSSEEVDVQGGSGALGPAKGRRRPGRAARRQLASHRRRVATGRRKGRRPMMAHRMPMPPRRPGSRRTHQRRARSRAQES